MSLSNPAVMVLLLLIPLAAGVFYWREGVRARRLNSLGWGLSVKGAVRTVMQAGLWLAAVACLIAALARPLWGVEVVPNMTQGVALVAVMDVSLSMDADDVQPSRLERAKLDLRRLIQLLDGNEVGPVVFADSALLQLPLTTDVHSADLFVQAVSTVMLSGQGTNIEAALQTGLEALSHSIAPQRVLLLLSDGENQTGSPLLAAGAANVAGVRVDALGYGTEAGSGIPLWDANGNRAGYKEDRNGEVVQTVLDEGVLRAITTAAGGTYQWASAGDGAESLGSAWQTVRPASVSETRTRPREQFPLFIGLAILLMMLERIFSVWRKSVAL